MMKKQNKTIILCGGGSGGHIYPILAIADELKDKAEVYILTEEGDNVADKTFADAGLKVLHTKAGKFRRYHGSAAWYVLHPTNIRENIVDGTRVIRGYLQAEKLLRRIKPDVVFSKGGYVGLPMGLAAGRGGIKVITHDSDVLPGMTNRILSRFADKLAVGFPREYYSYPSSKLVHTGTPVRQEFKSISTLKKQGQGRGDRPQVFIVGGSVGGRAINQAMMSIGKQLQDVADIVHVTGRSDYDGFKSSTDHWRNENRYKLYDFVGNKYIDYMSKCDVVICRAGATTLSECAAAKRPMIVVPNPRLTGGHQLRNAEALEDRGAAVIIGEPMLAQKPELLIEHVLEIFHSNKMRDWLTKNAAGLLPDDAANRIANILLEI